MLIEIYGIYYDRTIIFIIFYFYTNLNWLSFNKENLLTQHSII